MCMWHEHHTALFHVSDCKWRLFNCGGSPQLHHVCTLCHMCLLPTAGVPRRLEAWICHHEARPQGLQGVLRRCLSAVVPIIAAMQECVIDCLQQNLI